MSKKKTALVIRCGAYGDMIIISPLFRALREAGYEHIICHTGQRGIDVLKHNPYIDQYIKYDFEGKDNPGVSDQWEALEKKIKPDWCKNFAESIEVSVSLHPRSPVYNYPKAERQQRSGVNFYDVTASIAGMPNMKRKPDLFIKGYEWSKMQKHLKKDKFNILWNLSGSGANKVYPWSDYVMGEVIKNYPDTHFITTGDEKCQILEGITDEEHITNLSGKTSFRESMVLSGLVDLVVSPDTGVLHASGCWDVPKIGILGHTTIENISKYFTNDYSLEADTNLCECSPCGRLIYNHTIQCPIDRISGGAWCMSVGQPQQRLYQRIIEVINDRTKSSISGNAKVSTVQPA